MIKNGKSWIKNILIQSERKKERNNGETKDGKIDKRGRHQKVNDELGNGEKIS